jgi:hypothetical protein
VVVPSSRTAAVVVVTMPLQIEQVLGEGQLRFVGSVVRVVAAQPERGQLLLIGLLLMLESQQELVVLMLLVGPGISSSSSSHRCRVMMMVMLMRWRMVMLMMVQ